MFGYAFHFIFFFFWGGGERERERERERQRETERNSERQTERSVAEVYIIRFIIFFFSLSFYVLHIIQSKVFYAGEGGERERERLIEWCFTPLLTVKRERERERVRERERERERESCIT